MHRVDVLQIASVSAWDFQEGLKGAHLEEEAVRVHHAMYAVEEAVHGDDVEVHPDEVLGTGHGRDGRMEPWLAGTVAGAEEDCSGPTEEGDHRAELEDVHVPLAKPGPWRARVEQAKALPP